MAFGILPLKYVGFWFSSQFNFSYWGVGVWIGLISLIFTIYCTSVYFDKNYSLGHYLKSILCFLIFRIFIDLLVLLGIGNIFYHIFIFLCHFYDCSYIIRSITFEDLYQPLYMNPSNSSGLGSSGKSNEKPWTEWISSGKSDENIETKSVSSDKSGEKMEIDSVSSGKSDENMETRPLSPVKSDEKMETRSVSSGKSDESMETTSASPVESNGKSESDKSSTRSNFFHYEEVVALLTYKDTPPASPTSSAGYTDELSSPAETVPPSLSSSRRDSWKTVKPELNADYKSERSHSTTFPDTSVRTQGESSAHENDARDENFGTGLKSRLYKEAKEQFNLAIRQSSKLLLDLETGPYETKRELFVGDEDDIPLAKNMPLIGSLRICRENLRHLQALHKQKILSKVETECPGGLLDQIESLRRVEALLVKVRETDRDAE